VDLAGGDGGGDPAVDFAFQKVDLLLTRAEIRQHRVDVGVD